MEQNAIAALEVLHWCGVMAVRSGHLISLPTGMIGVEEACSGVRSLQSGIMAALFLGEMFRFGWFSRVALVGSAIGISLVGNFLRATGLSLLASDQGIDAIEKWHDMAGFLILGSTLGGIWFLAAWWKGRGGGGAANPTDGPRRDMVILPRSIGFLGGVVFLAGVLSLAGTEAWYRARGGGAGESAAWTIKPGTPGTQPVPVPDRTRRILFFPDGFSEKFVDASGLRWQVFYFRWPPGRTAVQAVGVHDPRTCLASIGMELESQLAPMIIEVEGVAFPFRVFLFRAGGRPVLVFHAILSDDTREGGINEFAGMNDAMEDYSMAGRFKMMARGIRNSGQTLFEAAVWGTTDVAEASNTLKAVLGRAVLKTQGGIEP
jgi:exosortase/archaeosortase family protein